MSLRQVLASERVARSPSVSGGRALNAIRRGRRTFATLALVCLALVGGATFLGSRALGQAEAQAQVTANALANAGVASVLAPEDLVGAVGGDTAGDLLSRLQRGVLADGTAFRVRVWSPAGDLLFSTDAADEPDAVSGDLDAVYAATRGGGEIASIRSGDGEEFATFVPLRLGQDRSLGAVEVDQGYERIAMGATSPWPLIRTVGIVVGALALLSFAVASLPGAGSRTGGFLSPGREASTAAQRAKANEEVIRAEERAKAAEEHSKEVEHRIRDAETHERDAEARATRAEAALEVAHGEMSRFRDAAAEALAASEEPDDDTLARIASLELEVATGAATLVDSERARLEASARAADLAQALRSAEANADRDREVGDQLVSVRAELTAAVTRATDAESRARDMEAKLEEAERRVAAAETRLSEAVSEGADGDERFAALEAEVLAEREAKSQVERAAASAIAASNARLAEMQARTRELEELGAESESRVTESEARLTESEARLQRAVAEANNAEQLVARLEGELLTANGSFAELERHVEISREAAERERVRAADLQARLAQVEARASSDGAKLQAATTGSAELRSLIHHEQQRTEAVQAELDERQTELDELRAASEEAAKVSARTLEETKAAAADQKRRRKEAQAELERATTRVAELELSRSEAMAELETVRSQTRHELDDARAAAEAATAEASDRIEIDRAQVRGRLASLEASLAEADGRVRAADDKVAAAAARADEAVAAAQAADAETAEANARADEAERAAASVDVIVRQAEVRAQEADAAAAKARQEAVAAIARCERAERDAAERSEAADSHVTDVERGKHELEVRVAEASESARAYKSEASEAARRATAAEERAETEIAAAKAEARTAIERARAEAVDAVRRATGSAPTSLAASGQVLGPGSEDSEELRIEIARLEDELEHMSERLRHAYSQVESAQGISGSVGTRGPDDPEGPRALEPDDPPAARSLRARLSKTGGRSNRRDTREPDVSTGG